MDYGFSKTSGAIARYEGEAIAAGLSALGSFMIRLGDVAYAPREGERLGEYRARRGLPGCATRAGDVMVWHAGRWAVREARAHA